MEWLSDPQAWIGLLTLTALEIVLGIDNIIFISILVNKLPAAQRDRARNLGLALAMFMRIGLLFSISLIMRLTQPLTPEVFGVALSGKDLILLVGGLFLIGKSTYEIHGKLEGEEHHGGEGGGRAAASAFTGVIVQILLLDLVFSLDSVITAVGMIPPDRIGIMVAAVVIAVGVMLLSAGAIARFVERHPTVKMLALSFLLMIGAMLVAEGLHQHIPKGYIYFAMAFSVFVELLNIKIRKHTAPPVKLHDQYTDSEEAAVLAE
jgi:predicted tellurium resistance membrane protein TerC